MRPYLDYGDQDWKYLGLNDETETNTEKVWVSMMRPRPKKYESQWRDQDWDWKGLSLNDKIETKTEEVWVSESRPRPRPQNHLD